MDQDLTDQAGGSTGRTSYLRRAQRNRDALTYRASRMRVRSGPGFGRGIRSGHTFDASGRSALNLLSLCPESLRSVASASTCTGTKQIIRWRMYTPIELA